MSAIEALDLRCASDLVTYLDRLSLIDGIQADWDTWEHDEVTHAGSVVLHIGRPGMQIRACVVSWSYEALDDPDNAVELPIPVDFHHDVVGALTPEQRERFWAQVNPELDPFEVLDAFLVKAGLIPTEHDDQDYYVMRYVLALEWFRAFPSLPAGEAALSLAPDLTDTVLGQLALMANRCALEGDNYELYRIFVEQAS